MKLTNPRLLQLFVFFALIDIIFYMSLIESLPFALGIVKILIIFFFLSLFSPFSFNQTSQERAYLYQKIFALLSFSVLWVGALWWPSVFWQYWSVLFLLVPCMLISPRTLQRWSDPIFWKVELVFIILIGVSLILFSLSPEWASGEKPMDLSYLNYFSRAGVNLKLDPWMSGLESSYYTAGFAISGIWALSAGLDGNQFYLVALSFWFAIFFFSLVLIAKSWMRPWLFLTLIPLGAWRYLAPPFDFSNFWKMTRVYEHPYFSEFPLWSYLFYDLHPHLISYSIVGLIFSYLLDFFKYQLKGRHLFFLSFSFVLLYFVNLWDFLFWGVALIIFSLFHYKTLPLKSFATVLTLVALLVGGHSLFFPTTQKIVIDLWNPLTWLQTVLAGFFWQNGLLLFLLGLFSWRKKNYQLMIFSFVVFIIFSFIIVMDSVNSVFKFQTSFYLLLMFLCLTLSQDLNFSKGWMRSLGGASVVILILMFGQRGMSFDFPTLSAQTFLSQHKNDEAELVKFIKEMELSENMTLLEAPSESFQYSGSLISTYSGVPSYLGWKGHLRIRGADSQEILRRSFISGEIYRQDEVEKTLDLLRQENIDLIVLGEKERHKYRGSGLAKFVTHPDFFEHLFSSQTIHLFRAKNP